MVTTRPHILRWHAAGEASGQDPVTGYPKPAVPGELIETPCRYRLGGTKEFKNEDNTVTKQVGQIRLDVGSALPVIGQQIEVVGHYSGKVKDIYKGQLSYRIDV